MEIQVTLGYTVKAGQTIDRIIINAKDHHEVDEIISKINKHRVSDSSVTCEDDSFKWGEFMEYMGQASISYEVPRKFTDAFYLYLKVINMMFFTK